MKRHIFSIVTACLVGCLISCHKEHLSPANDEELTGLGQCSTSVISKTFENATGEIKIFEGLSEPIYLIKTDYFIELNPCNLPATYRKNGQLIRFSGTAYDVPGTDIVALPLALTKLSSVE